LVVRDPKEILNYCDLKAGLFANQVILAHKALQRALCIRKEVGAPHRESNILREHGQSNVITTD